MLWKGIVLVVDDANATSLERVVVIKSRKLPKERCKVRVPDPPIEPHDVGMVFLHDLCIASQPVARILCAQVGVIIQRIMIFSCMMCWPIEICESWIAGLRRLLVNAIHK